MRRILILSGIVFLGLIAQIVLMNPAEAQNPGDYIVTARQTERIVGVTPTGIATDIFSSFPANAGPRVIAIDRDCSYIVAERGSNSLSRISPDGSTRTVIYSFNAGTEPVGVTIDGVNYIVTESVANIISRITPTGLRTVIYTYATPPNFLPRDIEIDSGGNYIVAEEFGPTLSRITPGGTRTVIYTFAAGTRPWGVAIDSDGSFLVTEVGTNKLVRISSDGSTRTEIFSFAAGSNLGDVEIDMPGNYIVCEVNNDILSSITPSGTRTVIYNFPSGSRPRSVAIYPSWCQPPRKGVPALSPLAMCVLVGLVSMIAVFRIRKNQ